MSVDPGSLLADSGALRAAYDEQLRGRPPTRLAAGTTCERVGPLLRFTGIDGGGFVEYRDLGGLDGAALDDLIGRQVQWFADRGEHFEWKLHGHDRPADLAERLRAAGLVPEEQETVVIGAVEAAAGRSAPPEGVTLREVTVRSELERIERLGQHVWAREPSFVAASLEAELAADPGGLTVVVAEAGPEVVSAGWIRFVEGTVFATLWGGSTHPEWRRRGVYRALVSYRASLARARGFGLLEVDASDESRPILERLGFVPVTTTTPYIWSPADARR